MMQYGLFDLTGHVAIVAGGAGHLGRAVCRGLLQHGAQVIVADRDSERADAVARELVMTNGEHRACARMLEIGDEDSIKALIDSVAADFGRLDILVNATYAAQATSLANLGNAAFTESLGVNVSSGFVLAREAKRAMPDGGRIVFFSSMYGRVSPDPSLYHDPMRPNPLEYGVAKAGIEQMVRYLAVAWASENIRVNGVAPGPFPSPKVQHDFPEFVERLSGRVPLLRVGRAEEIAGAIVFLSSNASSYVTGQTLVVDGGWTIW